MCIPRNNHHSSVISDEYGIFFWILFIVVEAETQIVVSALNWERFHLRWLVIAAYQSQGNHIIHEPDDVVGVVCRCAVKGQHTGPQSSCVQRDDVGGPAVLRDWGSSMRKFKLQLRSVFKVFLKLFWECEAIPHTSLVVNTLICGLNYFPTNKSWSWDFKSFT